MALESFLANPSIQLGEEALAKMTAHRRLEIKTDVLLGIHHFMTVAEPQILSADVRVGRMRVWRAALTLACWQGKRVSKHCHRLVVPFHPELPRLTGTHESLMRQRWDETEKSLAAFRSSRRHEGVVCERALVREAAAVAAFSKAFQDSEVSKDALARARQTVISQLQVSRTFS